MKRIVFCALVFCIPIAASASITSGSIDATYKYAWGDRIGWVNFAPAGGGLTITDGSITGYAWSKNYGWINFSPAGAGVNNNGEGVLSGYAWGQNIGYINFGGVHINEDGIFNDTATSSLGYINFNCSGCKVVTDWRPVSRRPSTSSSGSSGGGAPAAAQIPPKAPLSIRINGGASYTSSTIVILNLYGGPDAVSMAVSNFPDFYAISQEPYNITRFWDLCQPPDVTRTIDCKEGSYAVYAKFYTVWGQPSEVVSSTIIYSKSPPIAPSPNEEKIPPPEPSPSGGEKTTGIISKLRDFLGLLIPGFLRPPVAKSPPSLAELLPREAPLALKGPWNIMPEPEIREFVFAPLPKQIAALVQKFPGLGKTFESVGIAHQSDIAKLFGVRLSLPGVGEATGFRPFALRPGTLGRGGIGPVELSPGVMAVLPNLPLAFLSAEAKLKIPTEFLFVRSFGETLDFRSSLKLTDAGFLEPQIRTLVGTPLHLVVKPERPAKSVHGYLVLKGRSLPADTGHAVPQASLAASMFFATPRFSEPARNAVYHFIEPAEVARAAERPAPDVALPSLPQGHGPSLVAGREGGNTGNNIGTRRPRPDIVAAPSGERSHGGSNTGKNIGTGTLGTGTVENRFALLEFDYTDRDGDGIYTADINAPLVDGQYEVISVISYTDPDLGERELRLTAVVDPEGYVYESHDGKETRVPGAVVSLYYLNPETKSYALWPAEEFNQQNRQVTDVRGAYAFLVPDGFYYIHVDAPGYFPYESKPFQIERGASGVHVNIELKNKEWWLTLDWKTIALIAIALLLLYNFYRDTRASRLVPQ